MYQVFTATWGISVGDEQQDLDSILSYADYKPSCGYEDNLYCTVRGITVECPVRNRVNAGTITGIKTQELEDLGGAWKSRETLLRNSCTR